MVNCNWQNLLSLEEDNKSIDIRGEVPNGTEDSINKVVKDKIVSRNYGELSPVGTLFFRMN